MTRISVTIVTEDAAEGANLLPVATQSVTLLRRALGNTDDVKWRRCTRAGKCVYHVEITPREALDDAA
ncbi:MAG: hypothetical protein AAFQ35_07335 [Pseudomonadota bacterium]